MTLLPLDGFTVGITAHRRWEEQAELLRSRGAQVVHGPVIHTAPFDDTDALLACTADLIAIPPDVVVLMTGIGVRSWMAAADAGGRTDAVLGALHGTMVVARGPKAVGAASTAGLAVTWSSPSETSEDIIGYLADVGVRGRRVAVQRDGGPPVVAEALRALGAEVVDLPVYRWTLPDDGAAAGRLVDALCAGRLDAVTFTTAPAVENLLVLAGHDGRHDEARRALAGPVVVACVGPVTGAAARAAGATDVVEPARGRLGAMVQALTRRFASEQRRWGVDGRELVVQGATVAVDGERATLTAAERRALDELTARPGAVVTKSRLLTATGSPDADDHAAEVLVARLRRRLAGAAAVEAVPRRGYRWRASAS